MPKGDSDGPCSPKLEPQFARWGKRLAELGYVVLMPSSYAARGFCDMHVDTDRIPGTFDDRPEAVLGRLYDLDAASRFLCDQPEVDCDRLGVLGFSHGATMAMVALHWQIDHAIEYYRERSGNKADLKPGRPEFQVGVAYYPGCGTDGVLPLSISDKSSIYNKYFPTADLFVLHGSRDPLVELCSVEHGPGPREEQSAQVADYLGTEDTFHVKVYDQAAHGFDNAGGGGGDEKANSSRDKAARDAALKIALKQISTHLN
jgi:dienelactone hydrolase